MIGRVGGGGGHSQQERIKQAVAILGVIILPN